ncbi:MAG TPA: PEP-CTERM sorting domain-containing protein [Gemmatimonadales bacterium]|nr:PEP-CTERM sorting domain-containing protein [Gemmatimonadales bacterium]
MKLFKTLAAAAVLAATTASPAWADWDSGTVCGGGLFATCASVVVTTVDANTFTVTVTNLGGAEPGAFDATFFAVGLYNLPAGGTVSIVANADNNMVPGACSSLNPLDCEVAAEASPPPTANGVEVGETITFTVTFAAPFDPAALADVGVSIHAGDGPPRLGGEGTCSTKLSIEDEGGTVSGPPGEERDPACGETVIPEPITMTLLATGLAGMGGVGFLRRKREEDIG